MGCPLVTFFRLLMFCFSAITSYLSGTITACQAVLLISFNTWPFGLPHTVASMRATRGGRPPIPRSWVGHSWYMDRWWTNCTLQQTSHFLRNPDRGWNFRTDCDSCRDYDQPLRMSLRIYLYTNKQTTFVVRCRRGATVGACAKSRRATKTIISSVTSDAS